MPVIEVGNSIRGGGGTVEEYIVTPAAAAVAAIHAAVADNTLAADTDGAHAAVTDTGVEVVVTTGFTQPARPRLVTATAGGTSGDIKAIQVTVAGLDENGEAQSEELPAFTVNEAGTVTGAKLFSQINSVTIPAHDGTGATTEIGYAVTAATDQVITTGITNPDVPRNVTATADGTSGDVKAVSVIVYGTDINDNPISETLPAFTVNTTGTVVGNKAFKTITSYTQPGMDGNGATVSIGTGSKLGLPNCFSRNTFLRAFYAGTVEGTPPTYVIDDDEVSKNTVTLNTSLSGGEVVVSYWQS